jgi:hypothetical protein
MFTSTVFEPDKRKRRWDILDAQSDVHAEGLEQPAVKGPADDAVTGGVDLHAALEAITVGSDTIDMEADESFDTENSGVGGRSHVPFFEDNFLCSTVDSEPDWSAETPGLIYRKRERIVRPPWFPHGGHIVYRSQDGNADNFIAQAFMPPDAESVTIRDQDLPTETKWHCIRRAVCQHKNESPDSKPPCVIHIDDAGELLLCWQEADDEKNMRWVGFEAFGRHTFGEK